MALSKVAQYIKNVGKSVKYSTIDYIAEDNDAIAEYASSGQEIIKSVYHTFGDFIKLNKKTSKILEESEWYNIASDAFKNSINAIKTGEFNNKTKEEEAGMEIFGFDMDEFNLNDDDFKLDLESAKESGDITTGDLSIMDTVKRSSIKETSAVIGSMEASTKYITATSKANTSVLYSQGLKTHSILENGFGDLSNNIQNIYKFNTEVVQKMAENSKKYFETTTTIMKENNAILKEMLEMQRNIYKRDYDKELQAKKKGYRSITNMLSASGVPDDIDKYIKTIKKNFFDMLPIDEDSLKEFAKMIAANPMSFVSSYIAKLIVGPDIKKSLNKFSKSLGGLFATWQAKLMNKADGDNFFSQLFGIGEDKKTTINTSATYREGATPFDFETKRSIVEVIPAYLSRIESAITGQPIKLFDAKKGSWTNINKVKASYDNLISRHDDLSYSEENEQMIKYIKQLQIEGRKLSQKQLNEFEKFMKEMNKYRSSKHGYYDPNVDDIDYDGPNSDNYKKLYDMLYKQLQRTGHVAQSTINHFNSIKRLREELLEAENNSSHKYRSLFNNLSGEDDKTSISKINFRNMNLLEIKDKNDMNIYDYLNQIMINTSLMITAGSKLNKKGVSKNLQKAIQSLNKIPKQAVTNNIQKEIAKETIVKAEEDADIDSINALLMTMVRTIGDKDVDYSYILGSELQYLSDQADKNNDEGLIYQTNKMKELDKEIKDLENRDNSGLLNSNEKELLKEKKKTLEAKKKFLQDIKDKTTFKSLIEIDNKAKQVASKIFGKPQKFIQDIIEEANESLNQFLFEHEEEQEVIEGFEISKDGKRIPILRKKRIKGLMGMAKQKFGELAESVYTTFMGEKSDKDKSAPNLIQEWIENKYKTFMEDSKEAIGDIFTSIKDAVISTAHDAKYYAIKTPEEIAIEKAKKEEEEKDKIDEELAENAMLGFADGARNITKTGLTILSKGERVIPADENIYNPNMLSANRAKNRRDEQLIRNKYLSKFRNLPMYAEGTKSVDTNIASADEQVKNAEALIKSKEYEAKRGLFGVFYDQIMGKQNRSGKTYNMGDIKNAASNKFGKTVVDSGLGAIVGSFFEMPFFGAALGAAGSIIARSETLQAGLFGKLKGDGSRDDDGLISSDIRDSVKKYLPDIKNYGITGALAGSLIGIGPIGGLLLGSGIAFVKNNESMQELLFGGENEDNGMFSKETLKTIKKKFPTVSKFILGSLLIGATTPSIGILPALAIGTGIGLASTTDEFKEMILGTPDEKGIRHGGLAGAIKDSVVTPLQNFANDIKDNFVTWGREKIIDPIAGAIKPISKTIAIESKKLINATVKNLWNYITKSKYGLNFREKLWNSMLGRGIRKVGNFGKNLTKKAINPIKWLAERPSATIGWVGNKLKKRLIRSGDAAGVVDSAVERLEIMAGENYKNRAFDEFAAVADDETLAKSRQYLHQLNKNKNIANDAMHKSNSKIAKHLMDVLQNTGDVKKILKIMNSDLPAEKIEKQIDNKINGIKYIDDNTKQELRKYMAVYAKEHISKGRTIRDKFNNDNQIILNKFKDMGMTGVTMDNIDKYTELINAEEISRAKKNSAKETISENTKDEVLINDQLLDVNKESAESLKEISEMMAHTMTFYEELLKAFSNENYMEKIKTLNPQKYKELQAAHEQAKIIKNESSRKLKINIRDTKTSIAKSFGINPDKRGTYRGVMKKETAKEIFKDKALYKKLKSIQGIDGAFTDFDALMELEPNNRNKIIKILEYGYTISKENFNVVTSMSDLEFKKLCKWLKEGLFVDDINAIINNSEPIIDLMIDIYKLGFTVTNSQLSLFATEAGYRYKKEKDFRDKINQKIFDMAMSGQALDVSENGDIIHKINDIESMQKRSSKLSKLYNSIINKVKTKGQNNQKNIINTLNQSNITADSINTYADGGVVTETGLSTVSAGERIELATSEPVNESIKSEYGNVTTKRAMDGSLTPENNKENKLIQAKIADRDQTQKDLVSVLKELVGYEERKAEAEGLLVKGKNMAKKAAGGLLDLLNPMNWLKKFGNIGLQMLGPLAGPAMWLMNKTGNLAKTGANKAINLLGNTKLGQKFANTKIGKIAKGIGAKFGLGQIDETISTDPAEATNIQGKNIVSVLQQILAALTGKPIAGLGPDSFPGTTDITKKGKGLWGRLGKRGKIGLGMAAAAAVYGGYKYSNSTNTDENGEGGSFYELSPGMMDFSDSLALSTGIGGIANVGRALFNNDENMLSPEDALTIKSGKAATKESGMFKDVISKINSGFNVVMEKAKLFMGDKVVPKFQLIKNFIIEKVSNPGTMAKILKRLAGRAIPIIGIAITAAFSISAFKDAWEKAPSLLKISEEACSMNMKMLVGFSGAILAAIPFIGDVISIEDIVDKVIEYVGPIVGVTEQGLQKLRETSEKGAKTTSESMKKISDLSKEKVEIEDESGILHDINKATPCLPNFTDTASSLYESDKNWVKDKLGFGDNKDKTHSGTKGGVGRWGRGITDLSDMYDQFHSQLNPINAMNYNISGDTESQNMADSGCGPASAANIASALGKPMDTKMAAQYALDNGYKEKDGGTRPEFFTDYLGKNGIDINQIHNADVETSLDRGNPVLLMGQDSSTSPYAGRGRNKTPYGSYNHYVVATGKDKHGNMIIQDPESNRPNQKFKAKDVLSKTSFAMSAAAKGKWARGAFAGNKFRKADKGKWGRGNYDVDNAPYIWGWLTKQGFSNQAAAGIMGNLYAESKMNPRACQGGGFSTDITVDGKTGYGIAQWTFDTRQQGLLDYAKSKGKSSGELDVQLEYMMAEVSNNYPKVLNKMNNINTPEEAAEIWCKEYEAPDAELSHIDVRKAAAIEYFNIYGAGKANKGSVTGQIYAYNGKLPKQTSGNYKSSRFKGFMGLLSEISSYIGGFLWGNKKGSDNKSTNGGTSSSFSNTNVLGALTNQKATKGSSAEYLLANIPDGTVSSPYGLRNDGVSLHSGIDIISESDNNAKIPSPISGIVNWAATDGINDGGYGNSLNIKDNEGNYHTFAHMLQPPTFKEGDSIRKGDFLGQIGNTGHSFGEHLHYQIDNSNNPNAAKNSWENHIDPNSYSVNGKGKWGRGGNINLLQTYDDAMNSLGGIDHSKIPTSLMPQKSDNINVLRSKIQNINKKYGKGKWGSRGLWNNVFRSKGITDAASIASFRQMEEQHEKDATTTLAYFKKQDEELLNQYYENLENEDKETIEEQIAAQTIDPNNYEATNTTDKNRERIKNEKSNISVKKVETKKVPATTVVSNTQTTNYTDKLDIIIQLLATIAQATSQAVGMNANIPEIAATAVNANSGNDSINKKLNEYNEQHYTDIFSRIASAMNNLAKK